MPSSPPSPVRKPRFILFAALALFSLSVFVALGTWQLFRLQWKTALIARVESRVHAPPIALPAPSAWPGLTADSDEYRRVRVSGMWMNDKAARVQAVSELGAGYWLMVPLRMDDGNIVWVNRGFIAPELKLPVPAPQGEQTVTGLLRITQPGGGFLRKNDPAADRWYSRDVAALANSRGLTQVAPFFIDADAVKGQDDPKRGPVGGLTVIQFPNNHLQYALTWFALAAMVLAAFIWVIRDERRR
jgi:surfeit locus 1 family protein